MIKGTSDDVIEYSNPSLNLLFPPKKNGAQRLR